MPVQPQQPCLRPVQNFDDELLDHAMQVFSGQSGLADLQVDWSSSGPGFVKNEVCSAVQPHQQESLQTYESGERVVLKGLSQVNMNGEIGAITALLATGRYGVLLSGGGRIAVRPCNLAPCTGCQEDAMRVGHRASDGARNFRVGCLVWLTGLSDGSLNGFEGVIVSDRTASHRYGVLLSNGRRISVRDRNLRLVDESDEA